MYVQVHSQDVQKIFYPQIHLNEYISVYELLIVYLDSHQPPLPISLCINVCFNHYLLICVHQDVVLLHWLEILIDLYFTGRCKKIF